MPRTTATFTIDMSVAEAELDGTAGRVASRRRGAAVSRAPGSG